MNRLLIVLTLCMCSNAFATGKNPPQPPQPPPTEPVSTYATAEQSQLTEIILEVSPIINITQPESVGLQAAPTLTSLVEGDSVNVEGTNVIITDIRPDDITIRNTPNLGSNTMIPSGPCFGTVGAGASGTGIGLNVGFSRLDKGCDLREFARSFDAMGERSFALSLLCSSDRIPDDLVDTCPTSSGSVEIPELAAALDEQTATINQHTTDEVDHAEEVLKRVGEAVLMK